MDAKHNLLRDAGVLPLACAIMLAGAGGAAAMSKPDPHNFVKPAHVLHVTKAPSRTSLEGH